MEDGEIKYFILFQERNFVLTDQRALSLYSIEIKTYNEFHHSL
jgi:hypothetical protein